MKNQIELGGLRPGVKEILEEEGVLDGLTESEFRRIRNDLEYGRPSVSLTPREDVDVDEEESHYHRPIRGYAIPWLRELCDEIKAARRTA